MKLNIYIYVYIARPFDMSSSSREYQRILQQICAGVELHRTLEVVPLQCRVQRKLSRKWSIVFLRIIFKSQTRHVQESFSRDVSFETFQVPWCPRVCPGLSVFLRGEEAQVSDVSEHLSHLTSQRVLWQTPGVSISS